MKSDNRIKVFISSKCDDETTGSKYSDIRSQIKKKIEGTGLADVYVFEEENSSTLSALEHYSMALEDSDVCIFLIDNSDGIPSGVQNEIDIVQKHNIKALYYFCDETSTEKTAFEKSILTAENAKSKTVHKFADLSEESCQALINDITRIYHYYCNGRLLEWESASLADPKKDSTILKLQGDTSFPKTILNNIDQTTAYIYQLIMRTTFNRQSDTNEIDECARLFLEVVLGYRSINEFNVGVLLEKTKTLQTEQMSTAVKMRWQAIQAFYKGNVDNCLVELNRALDYSRNCMPRWFVNDLLIDLRNIHNMSCIIKNCHTVSSAQEELDSVSESLYYPILDRINETLQEKFNEGLYKETIKSPYTVSFGNNIKELSSLLATSFIVAVYFGSLTHIRLIKEKLKALFFYLTNIYDDWRFKYNLFKYAICEGNNKEIRELRSTYPEILNRLNSDEANEIVDFCSRNPIEYARVTSRLRAFSFVGYYLDDESFKKHCEDVESDLKKWVTTDNPIVEEGRFVFDSLTEVAYRLDSVKLVTLCTRIMDAGWSIYYQDMFKLIGKRIALNELPTEIAMKLVNQIVAVAEDEKTRSLIPISMFTYLKRQGGKASTTIDECVKKNYPAWYDTYALETTDDESVTNNYYRKTIEHVKNTLESLNSSSVRAINGSRDIYNLYLMQKNTVVSIDDELMLASVDLMQKVLLSARCSIISKMDAILLLCYMRINHPSLSDLLYKVLSKMSISEERILNVDIDMFSANIDLLALKCAVKMLSIFTGKCDYAGLVELLALVKNDVPTVLSVSRFIVDLMVGEYKNKLGNNVEWLLLINSLEWMHMNNNEARANATRILIALSYNVDNSEIINRTLVNIVRTENVYLKNLVLRKMNHAEGISEETRNTITEICLQDQNFVTRAIANGKM